MGLETTGIQTGSWSQDRFSVNHDKVTFKDECVNET
jgi:hypothetical protein